MTGGRTGDSLAAIIGVGYTDLTRREERPIGAVAAEAALAAVADAGIDLADVDGYVGAPQAPNRSAAHEEGVDEIPVRYMLRLLGLRDVTWAIDVTKLPGGMIASAVGALASGLCRYVLAVRAMDYPRGKSYQLLNRSEAGGTDQFYTPYGVGPLGMRYALATKRYLHRHGVDRKVLFDIVKQFRDNALRNEFAYWRERTISLDDYLDARPIVEPMCLYDFDLPVTGAGALLLTSTQRARQRPRGDSAYVSACRYRGERDQILPLGDWTVADLQCAQLYDGFSPFVLDWLGRSDLGSTALPHEFVADGGISRDGALPVNTFGGSLGEGRLHGIGHLREAVQQVRGRAGARQLPDVDACFVQVGIPEESYSVVLRGD